MIRLVMRCYSIFDVLVYMCAFLGNTALLQMFGVHLMLGH